jgi:hypothetical protein
VAGRALAFADPEIMKMASHDYVPVTGDDWYQRRRDDPEGKFFRHVADQGPRKGEGGSTRQGIYCLTADGQLLAYKNAGQAPDVMREVLRHGLDKWSKLPDSRRRPGAIVVKESPRLDTHYQRQPPAGGLILTVSTRILDGDARGKMCKGTCSVAGGDRAARDHMWLTADECRNLIPANPRTGDSFPLGNRIAERIARFHLVDNTRGEPPMWRNEDIRSSHWTVTVEEAAAARLRLRLEGTVLLSTATDPESADRGFNVRLLGYLEYDRKAKTIDHFDIVALGDHWGRGTYTGGARPGRTPLGIAFTLADPADSSARVPPQAARDIRDYVP